MIVCVHKVCDLAGVFYRTPNAEGRAPNDSEVGLGLGNVVN